MSWTIGRIIEAARGHLESRGVEEARFDAEILLAAVLKVDRLRLYTGFDMPVSDEERARYRELIQRRARREPVAYILGRREFYGRDFSVDRRVLIPRSETEMIVDRMIAIESRLPPGPILDIGTGSGCLAVTLALELPRTLHATDLSADALAVAKANAGRLQAPPLQWFEGDLYEPLPAALRYAAIVANPPYIDEQEAESLAIEVREHEPVMALYSAERGLSVTRRILLGLSDRLLPGGVLLLELGMGQDPFAQALAKEILPASKTSVEPDLSGIPRLLEVWV